MPQSSRLDARPPRLGPAERDDGGLARQTYGGQAPGILHHVIWGGWKEKIYSLIKDRQDFVTRLAALAEDKSMDIYGWVLLPIPLKKKYL